MDDFVSSPGSSAGVSIKPQNPCPGPEAPGLTDNTLRSAAKIAHIVTTTARAQVVLGFGITTMMAD